MPTATLGSTFLTAAAPAATAAWSPALQVAAGSPLLNVTGGGLVVFVALVELVVLLLVILLVDVDDVGEVAALDDLIGLDAECEVVEVTGLVVVVVRAGDFDRLELAVE